MDDRTATTRLLEPKPELARLRRFALVVERAGEPPRTVESSGSEMRVGARPGNDLVLADETASRIHFEVVLDANGFRLRDLGSTNGTWVDGMRVADGYLRDGARIVAGRTQLLFRALSDELSVPLSNAERFGALVGRSAVMRELFARLERVAQSDLTVLVEGESGTGKELVAEAIHAAGPRARGPFVVFDCAAIPAAEIEVELLGAEGPAGVRAGAIEQAEGGTLLLDEIGELPLDLQSKLLRALEKRQVRRVGGREVLSVDARVVAATHRDLAREVNQGSFREDLYYRLAVVRLTLPPLAARADDIRPLAEHFLREALPNDAGRAARVLASITEESWRRLEGYPWRGNVRELRNVMLRALALSDPSSVEPLAPGSIRSPTSGDVGGRVPQTPGASSSLGIDWDRGFLDQRNELLARFEHEYVVGMLERQGGKISRAAIASGLDRSHYKRLLARVRR